MKNNAYTSAMVLNSVIWISSAALIAYTVNLTGSTKVLWFLLVPLFGGYSVNSHESNKEDG